MRQVLWIVIPCYNEEAVLPLTAPAFLKELTLLIDTDRISDKSRILFVDDGSKDKTLAGKLADTIRSTGAETCVEGHWHPVGTEDTLADLLI